jgi:hypothetical protein
MSQVQIGKRLEFYGDLKTLTIEICTRKEIDASLEEAATENV